jgi:hypothetical protein
VNASIHINATSENAVLAYVGVAPNMAQVPDLGALANYCARLNCGSGVNEHDVSNWDWLSGKQQ